MTDQKLVTDFICPACGALPGERCGNIAGFIWGYHDERHEAADAANRHADQR